MAFTLGTKPRINSDQSVKEWREIRIKGDAEDGSEDTVFSLLISSLYAPRVRARQGYIHRSAAAAAEAIGAGSSAFSVTPESVDAMVKVEEQSLFTLAQEVVHDWKDVNNADGTALEYSASTMVQILREWPSVRAAVEEHASEIGLGIAAQTEETKAK